MGRRGDETELPAGRHNSESSNGSLRTQFTVVEPHLNGQSQGVNGHKISMPLKKDR
jgi:hypothetical protein